MVVQRALVKLILPQQVVAVPSTDTAFAMEATIPMVLTETAGVAAFFNGFAVSVRDESNGTSRYAPIVRLNTVGTVPAGGSVEVPFRVQLSGAGPYRAKVILTVTDAGDPEVGSTGARPTRRGSRAKNSVSCPRSSGTAP
jgi:hypothetical protein